MSIGTFGTFTTARLGIYAAQKGLSVVGNNIANINTTGYTRQVLDQVSLSVGGSDLYRSQFDAKVGSGALVRNINQIRDPYLDIRYRTEMASVGAMDKKLSGLNDIAAILDEIGKGENKGDGLLYAQFQKLSEALRALGSSAGSQSNDTLAKSAAEALTTLFHTYADKLETLQKNTETAFKQDLAKTNEILTNIRDLNDSIRNSEIYGDRALELRDERNRLIDELSQYMKIDVVYTEEDIGAGRLVEKLTIRLANANPDPDVQSDSSILVDGIFAAQLEMPESFPQINPQYDPSKVDPNDPDTEIFGFKYLNDAGAGTNDEADAKQVPNDNYNLSLTKLLDAKGREWISSSTVKKPIVVAPGDEGTPAKYAIDITKTGVFAAGDKITMGSQEFIVGQGELSLDIANDSIKLANFLATKINGRQNKDYTVVANNGKLELTAKNPGQVGSQGPDAPKDLLEIKIEMANRTTPTLSFRNPTLTTPGVDADPNATPPTNAIAAIYTMALNSSKNWQDGDTFEIDGTTFTVGAGAGQIPAADANDPAKMALFLAGNLNNNDYNITANGSNLVFTSKTPGAAANNAPPTKPANATVTVPARTAPTVTFGKPTADPPGTIPGTDANLPTLTPPADTPEVTYTITQQRINGQWYEVTTAIYHTQPVNLDDNDLFGSLQSARELLTEAGEFSSSGTINGVDESAAVKRGIPYYRKSLDLLARQFAQQYNSLNNGHLVDENGNYLRETGKKDDKGNPIYEKLPELTVTYYVDKDGNYLGTDPADAVADGKEVSATLNKNMTDNETKAFNEKFPQGIADADGNTYTADSIQAYLDANGVKHSDGGNLFSKQGDTDDADGITAANISISLGWSKGDTHIVTSYMKPFGDVQNTTQSENVSHMISMIDKPLEYNPQDLDPDAASTHLFKGSFNDMMDNMCSVLGNDRRSTNVMLNTYYAAAVELDTGRDSVSGVDLNDEAMNMMQYQKAYSAACRLMTAIDEALDRLINNTGLAGR